jgi:hypothetical protein
VAVTVFCDECGGERSGDYIVPAGAESLQVARLHLAAFEGWLINDCGDFCPDCKPKPGDTLHVYPTGDHIEHDTDSELATCACKPRMEAHSTPTGIISWLIIHNALDGREEREVWETFAELRAAVWCVCDEFLGVPHLVDSLPHCTDFKEPPLAWRLDKFRRDAVEAGIPLPPVRPIYGQVATQW